MVPWLVVWNILFSPYIGNNHPNWLSYFSEGWPNHQPATTWCLTKMPLTSQSAMVLKPDLWRTQFLAVFRQWRKLIPEFVRIWRCVWCPLCLWWNHALLIQFLWHLCSEFIISFPWNCMHFTEPSNWMQLYKIVKRNNKKHLITNFSGTLFHGFSIPKHVWLCCPLKSSFSSPKRDPEPQWFTKWLWFRMDLIGT